MHVGVAQARIQVMPPTIRINGQAAASTPPPGLGYASTASAEANVHEALTILGQSTPPNWVELYKMYEIIEHTGQLKAAMGAAGVSASQISRFTRTACHPDAAGLDARHGRSRQDPPKNPMPIGKANELIGTLMRAWMDQCAADKPASPPR